MRCGSEKIGMARESFRALIPCKRPKTNDNGKYKRVIEIEEENGGQGFSSGSAM